MVNLNKVFLAGNLTRDPELRYTPQGTAVATLGLAVNTSFKDKNGETKKDVCFINVIAWGQLAEVCNQYLEKGKGVIVEGRLTFRSWKNSEGKTRNVVEVRASSVQFMPRGVKASTPPADLGSEPKEVINLDNKELGEVS